MVSVEGIIQSLLSNWVTIVVTTLATGVTLYVSVKYQTNAREERLNQAKQATISIIEEHIIDSKDLKIEKFDNLISAAEREHSVPLSESVSKVSLLEDLTLKIEKSPHLNSEQKEEYTNQIQEKISKIRNNEQVSKIDKDREEILDSISKNIEDGNEEIAIKELDTLKDEISKLEERSHNQIQMESNLRPVQTLIIVGATFVIWFFIINNILNVFSVNLPNVLPYIIIVFVILIYSTMHSFYNIDN